MKDEDIVLSHFVWDDYQIDFYKSIVSEVESLSNQEKSEIVEEMVIFDVFKLRRVRDLGFREFITKEIFKGVNETNFKLQVFDIISRYFQNTKEIQEIIYRNGLHYAHERYYSKYRQDEKDYEAIKLQTDPNDESISKYYFLKSREFTENNDLYGNRAIEILITEKVTGLFGGYALLIDHESIEGSLYEDQFKYEYKKYLTKELKYWLLYFYPNAKPFDNSSLLQEIDNEISEYISALLKDNFNISENKFPQYQPLIQNSIDVISCKWFWELPKSKKVELLIRTYNTDKFDINKITISNAIPKSLDLDEQNFFSLILNSSDEALVYFDSFFFSKAIEGFRKVLQIFNQAKGIPSQLMHQIVKFKTISMFYLAESYFYLMKFDLARKNYYKLISTNNKHHNSVSMVVLLSKLSNESLDNKIIDYIEDYGKNDLFELSQFYIENIFRVFSVDDLSNLVTHLITIYKSANKDQYLETEFYLDIGGKLADVGFQDQALEYYDKGLQGKLTNKIKELYLTNIGTVFANLDDHLTAIQKYKEAIQYCETDDEKSLIYGNIGASYGVMMEYEHAIENIQKCIDLLPKIERFEDFKNKRIVERNSYQLLIGKKVLLNRIPQHYDLVKQFLRTAEMTYQIYVRNQKFQALDASSIVTYYAKTVERLLYLTFLKPYKNDIDDDQSKRLSTRALKRSSSRFARVLRKYRKGEANSLTLGEWLALKRFQNDPVNTHLFNYFQSKNLMNIFTSVINILETTVVNQSNQTLLDLRNDVSHMLNLDYHDLVNLKIKIIDIINNIIEVIFPIT